MKTFKEYITEQENNVASIAYKNNTITFYRTNDYCESISKRLSKTYTARTLYSKNNEEFLELFHEKYGSKIFELQSAYMNILESITNLAIAEFEANMKE